MGYPSLLLLENAATGLRGAHNFAVISVPALLRQAEQNGQPPTTLVTFGSKMEREILDRSFKLGSAPKPYVSVWSDPPVWLESDIARRGIQAQRTRDAFASEIFIDDAADSGGRRSKFALTGDAGKALLRKSRAIRIVDLAVWFGRNENWSDLMELLGWFRSTFPAADTDLMGTVYLDEVPDAYTAPEMWSDVPPSSEQLLRQLKVGLAQASRGERVAAAEPRNSGGLQWTRELVDVPLASANVQELCDGVRDILQDRNVVFRDTDQLVRRCVVALLTGHLVLQGPPGTGKTTLARALAKSFEVDLDEVTATSEWTPYNVVGGFRMSGEGLQPHYGCVSATVLQCAEVVTEWRKRPRVAEPDQESLLDSDQDAQAVWLLIDEFNRADIDKAIGSLYTLLGSNDPSNLASSPIDLWFEASEDRRRLWSPGRFRIIGAMNDLDSSYVNRISQGLTRRFQFVTVDALDDQPTESYRVTNEVLAALAQAHDWLDRVYGRALALPVLASARVELEDDLTTLSAVVSMLRTPGGVPGWPVGTAQVVDVLKALLIELSSGHDDRALDRAVTDRLVPQMGAIDDEQYDEFSRRLEASDLVLASRELRRLINPHFLS